MDRQLSHMVRLVDDLLDVSRINRNKMELRCTSAAGRRGVERRRDHPDRLMAGRSTN